MKIIAGVTGAPGSIYGARLLEVLHGGVSGGRDAPCRLARLGVMILPASPGFYFQPRTPGGAVDHVAGKTLNALGLEQNLFEKWRGQYPARRHLPGRGHRRGIELV